MNPFREGAAGKYFVGRDDQLKRFTRSLTALRNGEPAHLYVAGVNGRGKTSYLEKLVEMAREKSGVLAVRVALDGGVRAQQQILAMFEKLLRKIDEVHTEVASAPRLVAEWRQVGDSPFQLPTSERLQNDHLLQDLAYVRDVVAELGFRHLVLCVDEGERIEPYALSALKSALLELQEYLVVLSIRLAEDHGDPVRAGKLKLEEIAAAADRDMGAARLFVGGVGLGSFTPAQARRCVARRLEDNAIRFDDEVIGLIGRVAEGLPDRIISYAHEVYDRTEADEAEVATTDTFRQTFVSLHQFELDAAKALCAQSTGSERRALRELATHDVPLTPLELAKKLYTDVPVNALEPVAEALRGVLDRVGDTVRVSAGGRYLVPDAVRRYALEISMEPE
ncbi:ATP-binding protein [Streptosporangium sp. NPDC051023]|uniref:ATP-binding protein n=1 Tax=Streptosporangium sp. NPDC051023 TaxID=3155410 RepID=UPI00344D98A3